MAPLTTNQVRVYAQRSGDIVNDSRDIWGMAFSVLLPFIVAGLTFVEDRTIVDFDESYLHVLEGFVITFGGSLIARWRMRRLRAADAEAEGDPIADELRYADEKIGRLEAQVAALQTAGRPAS